MRSRLTGRSRPQPRSGSLYSAQDLFSVGADERMVWARRGVVKEPSSSSFSTGGGTSLWRRQKKRPVRRRNQIVPERHIQDRARAGTWELGFLINSCSRTPCMRG